MDKLTWQFELADKMTGPAKRITGALDRIKGALGKLAKSTAAQTVGSKFSSAMKQHHKSSMSAVDGLKSLAKWGAVAGAAAIAGGLFLAKSGATMAIEMATFKEDSIRAFSAMTGSTQKGQDLFAHVLEMAKFFKTSPVDATRSIQGLMAAGFKTEQALSLFQSAMDIAKFNPQSDIGQISDVLAQIQSATKLTTQDLKQIGITGGVGVGNIIAQLGKLKGIDTSTTSGFVRVQKMIEAGSFSSAEAIGSIQAAINKLTGSSKAGEFAAKASLSLGGLIQGIKSAPEQFFLRMSVDDGPIRRFLVLFNEALDPNSATGQRVIQFLNETGEKLAGLFSNVTAKGIQDFIGGMVSFGATVVRLVGTLGGLKDGFMLLWKPVSDLLVQLGLTTGKSNVLISVTRAVMTVFGLLAGAIVVGVGAIAAAAFGIGYAFAWFTDQVIQSVKIWWDRIVWFKDQVVLSAQWWGKIGSDIVNGLWNGIKAGWASMLKGFTELVNLLPDSVKRVLGISSPSKVMMSLGGYTALGFQQGLNDNSGGVRTAYADLVATPSVSNSSISNVSSRSVTPQINIEVNVAALPGQEARDVGKVIAFEVRRVLHTEFDGLAASMG